MLTMKEWMELVKYRITEGGMYGWYCYGSNAYNIDSWNGIHDTGGYSSSIVFDTKTQTVFEATVCDYTNSRAYRLINPDYKKQYLKESKDRGCVRDEAWDDVLYTDLECDDDFMQKTLAIVEGKSYDTRISVPIEFDDNELLKLFKIAHEKDITLNQLVEQALQEFIVDQKQIKVNNYD